MKRSHLNSNQEAHQSKILPIHNPIHPKSKFKSKSKSKFKSSSSRFHENFKRFQNFNSLKFYFNKLKSSKSFWFFNFLILLIWLSNHQLILFRFKFLDFLFSLNFLKFSIFLRKSPLIFIHSSNSISIVWESNQFKNKLNHQIALSYQIQSNHHQFNSTSNSIKFPKINRLNPSSHNDLNRWVHSALIENLIPNTIYSYNLILIHPNSNSESKSKSKSESNQITESESGSESESESDFNSNTYSIIKTLSTHQFIWLGLDQSSPSISKSKNLINSFHIIIIGDNQFGVKKFQKIVKKFINLKSLNKNLIHSNQNLNQKFPNLIFHLGDLVQDAQNLKQWQTDFWDPFTFKNKLISQIPILYARGNHDFDSSAQNFYSGGLPKVQLGEINRTQNSKLFPSSQFIIPTQNHSDDLFTTLKIHNRHPNSRATYHAYSPHPRLRVLVCDSNLDPAKRAYPWSNQSEVDEHERWLIWEMARPEWKNASIRIIIVHVPPFVEYWDEIMWNQAHESDWGSYVRNRFTAHFHATSPFTIINNIPPASMVISGHSHAYSRGFLSNTYVNSLISIQKSKMIPKSIYHALQLEHHHFFDPTSPQNENGVIYIISGGAGGVLDRERVEDWGFYEKSITGEYHFNHLTIEMSQNISSVKEWQSDWQENQKNRIKWKNNNIRVYKLMGSQLDCQGSNQHDFQNGHFQSSDKLIWSTYNENRRLIDRFIIEADSCR